MQPPNARGQGSRLTYYMIGLLSVSKFGFLTRDQVFQDQDGGWTRGGRSTLGASEKAEGGEIVYRRREERN